MIDVNTYIIRLFLEAWQTVNGPLPHAFVEFLKILAVSIAWIGGLILWIKWKEKYNYRQTEL